MRQSFACSLRHRGAVLKSIVIAFGCALALASCASFSRMEIDFAKHFVMLTADNFNEIRKQLDPERWLVLSAQPAIQKMAGMVPAAKFDSVGVTWTSTMNATVQTGETASTEVVLFYHYSKGNDLRAIVVIHGTPAGLRATTVNFAPLPHGLIDENSFSLWGKPFLNYVALFFAAIVILLIIDALIQLARSPRIRRRWLWTIFILFGFFQISLNWTTGGTGINFLMLQFLGVGMTRSEPWHSPWMSGPVDTGGSDCRFGAATRTHSR